MNPMDLLKYEFGSLKDLADKLEIKPNTVYLWGQTKIPVGYLKQISELTEGRLTKEILRPDLFKKD